MQERNFSTNFPTSRPLPFVWLLVFTFSLWSLLTLSTFMWRVNVLGCMSMERVGRHYSRCGTIASSFAGNYEALSSANHCPLQNVYKHRTVARVCWLFKVTNRNKPTCFSFNSSEKCPWLWATFTERLHIKRNFFKIGECQRIFLCFSKGPVWSHCSFEPMACLRKYFNDVSNFTTLID